MELRKIILDFSEQIEALKAYIDSFDLVMNSISSSYSKSEEEDPFMRAVRNLSRLDLDSKRDPEAFLKEMRELNEVKEIFPEDLFDKPENLINFLAESFSTEKFKFRYKDNKVSIQISDFETQKRFDGYIKVISMIYKQQTFFTQTALIALTNTYEFYIGSLMRDYITRNFDSLKPEQKSISYQEVFGMDNIDEVKDRIISNITDEYLKRSNQKWTNVIFDSKKDVLRELAEEQELINEIFQRRHIVVHNGGIVNRYYINNVKEQLRKDVKIDDEIFIDKEYLQLCLSSIYMFFVKIVFHYWCHNEHSEQEAITERFNVYQKLGFDRLMDKDYKMAESIYDLIKSEFSKLRSDERLLFSVNYCQTLKWLKKDKEFERYFRKIDFSLADKPHILCKHLLQDDFKQASIVLSDLLQDISEEAKKSKSNDLNYYIDWPIFQEFKNSFEFKSLISELGYERN